MSLSKIAKSLATIAQKSQRPDVVLPLTGRLGRFVRCGAGAATMKQSYSRPNGTDPKRYLIVPFLRDG
jgi:hypothetical protein